MAHPLITSVLPLALLLIAMTPASKARGATWQLIESRSRSQTELDVSSIVRKDSRATAWVQHTYSKLASSESGAYFAYRSVKEQLRLHCGERTVSVLSRAYFNDEGNEIALIQGKGETRPVAPDSVEQRVMARMCAPATPATARTRGAAPRTDIQADAARIDAAKRIAGAPVAPAPPAPVAALASNQSADAATGTTRFMDGPASTPARSGFIKAKENASAGAQMPETRPADRAAGEPLAKSAAAPATESRKQTMARVLRERGHADHKGAANGSVSAQVAHAAAGAGHKHSHWSYDGEFSPWRWGDMKAEYSTCKSGTRQSPIDIRNPVVSEFEPVQFHYGDVPLRVGNNGHTIEVDYAPGSFILHGGTRYELVQFHFHTPSEERINGRAFDMVAHLLHKSAQGEMAVVAVLFTAGREQPLLQQIWNAMPGTPRRSRERLDVTINAKALLPADRALYSFIGSLTTPPCTEGVQWLVMKTPVDISREQISHFAALYPMNARPLQAHNDRLIKAGR